MNHLEEVETVVAQKMHGEKLLNDLTAALLYHLLFATFSITHRCKQKLDDFIVNLAYLVAR